MAQKVVLAIWNNVDSDHEEYVCQIKSHNFGGAFKYISGIGDTPFKALYEWCVAMQGAIEVELEDDR